MEKFLQEYEKLNDDGRKLVDVVLNGALDNPEYLKATSKEELLAIKQKNEEKRKKKEIEDKQNKKYFAELKAESEIFSKDDYIARLNELFAELPTYKLRYFFLFITAKLHYDEEAGAING